MNVWQSELYGNYRQRKFTEIFPDVNIFKQEYSSTSFSAQTDIVDLDLVYYLLYAEYGNSPISNSDENQFKYRLWSTIFMYGPSWAKRLDIQDKLRKLTEEELLTGGRAIHNHAYNDGSQPTTASLEALDYINDQNTTNYKKSKMEGYEMLATLIETDVSKEFIDKFRPLFLKFVSPEVPLWYKNESEVEI
jgi:hypothetical protein